MPCFSYLRVVGTDDPSHRFHGPKTDLIVVDRPKYVQVSMFELFGVLLFLRATNVPMQLRPSVHPYFVSIGMNLRVVGLTIVASQCSFQLSS